MPSLSQKKGRILVAIAFSLPLWPQLTIGLTALACLLSLKNIPSGFQRMIRSSSLRWNFLLFLGLVIGLGWTQSMADGWKECKDELYLLLFPLLFSASGYSSTDLHHARKGLIAGSLTATAICLAVAVKRFLASGNGHVFFYTNYSFLLHPTNFGVILCISLLFLMDQWRKASTHERTPWTYLTILLLAVSLVLLSSKVIYLGVILLTGLAALISIVRKDTVLLKDRKMLTVFALVFVSVLLSNRYYNRTTQVVDAVKSESTVTPPSKEVDSSMYNSTTIRVAQWKYSFELIRRQPLYGNGTGDEVPELMNIFREHNDPYALLHFRHAHSFYLHYVLMLGILGLFLSFGALLVPLYIAWKNRWMLMLFFYALMLLIGFTDIITHATLGAVFAFTAGLLISEKESRSTR